MTEARKNSVPLYKEAEVLVVSCEEIHPIERPREQKKSIVILDPVNTIRENPRLIIIAGCAWRFSILLWSVRKVDLILPNPVKSCIVIFIAVCWAQFLRMKK